MRHYRCWKLWIRINSINNRRIAVAGNAPVVYSDELVDIPDEEIPLADVPKTGDLMSVWMILAGTSLGGLVLLGKKKA